MTDQSLPARVTIDTVVRSFTESELALADVTGAIAKFQTASEQLRSAEADNLSATQALTAATEASAEVAQQLHGLVAGLGETVAVLRDVDPDGLWAHLKASEQHHEASAGQRATDQAELDRRLMLLLRLSSLAAVAAVGALLVACLLAAGVV